MRYDLRFHGETLDEIGGRARAAEQAGFGALWSQELYTNPFVSPAAVLGFTREIRVGSAIALGFVRSPLSMATTALEMDRLSNGRFILGLGSGVQRQITEWHGASFGRPAPHLKECIQLTRLIIQNAPLGKPITFEGEYYKVNIKGFSVPRQPVRGHIPIYAAAIGPGMARVCGEVADGVLGQIMASLAWIQDVVLPNLKIGLDRAGRQRKEIDLSLTVAMAISKDVKKAKRDLAKTMSFYSTVGTYHKLFAAQGFDKEVTAVREAFRKHGRHGPHCWELIPDEMVDAYFVSGSPDDARQKVAQYEGIADSLVLVPPSYFLDSDETMEYEQSILETFGT